jgi:hypothetical protein
VICVSTGIAQVSVPTNGLIGNWPGNGSAVDLSTNENNGSFGGNYAADWTDCGTAFDLSSGVVSMPYIPAYNFKSYPGWSVGFWFDVAGTPISGSNPAFFIGEDNGSGYNPKWFIDYGYTVFSPNSDYVFHVNDYNQERIFITSQSESSPVGWNQLTVTIDNTNSGLVSFYLNGQPIGSGYLGSDYVLETTANLLFGEAEGSRYTGLMADVVIYDRVLATNEISQLATILPMAITQQPADVSVSTGGTAVFVVGVTGSCSFNYQWAFNGTNISEATNMSLTVTNVSPAQVGLYTVTITNYQGSLTSVGATLTTVDIRMVAALIINGVVSTNYIIQATSSIEATNWMTLTNFDLPTSLYIYPDLTSITNPYQFYRVFTTP